MTILLEKAIKRHLSILPFRRKRSHIPPILTLHRKIIKKCLQISRSLPVRQSYTRTLKELSNDQQFRNHPKNYKKALRADKKIKVIAGRLVRELERNTGEDRFRYAFQIRLFNRALSQGRNSKDKIYSLHEPEVVFRNEYDGHTIDRVLDQVKRITGKTPGLSACDRGYRGQKQSGDTKIEIPRTPKLRDTRYRKQKKCKLFCKRVGIEAGTGHLKRDHRLGRNFYRGLQGDAISIMPVAVAFNFKRDTRLLLWLIQKNQRNIT